MPSPTQQPCCDLLELLGQIHVPGYIRASDPVQ